MLNALVSGMALECRFKEATCCTSPGVINNLLQNPQHTRICLHTHDSAGLVPERQPIGPMQGAWLFTTAHVGSRVVLKASLEGIFRFQRSM